MTATRKEKRATSLAKLKGASSLGVPVFSFLGAALMAQGALAEPAADQTPFGEQVVGGSASFDRPADNLLNITQHSDRALINWDSFDIGVNATTEFFQNSSSSIAVNRVVGPGNDPTQILGTLKANGQVMVLDRNGVFFGKDARIDVGGIVASTGDLANPQAFLDGSEGTVQLTDFGNGTVENQGMISVAEGGLAALVAPTVVNSGTITAKLGKVELAAGNTTATVDFYGDGLVEFAVTPESARAVVENSGVIDAEGGVIAMTTGGAQAVVDSVINMSGVAKAKSVSVEGGKIVLGGTVTGTGDNAQVKVIADTKTTFTGKIEAAGKNADIEVSGYELELGGTFEVGEGANITFDPVTLTIGAAEAATIVSAMGSGSGSTVYVEAEEQIILNAAIDTSGGANNTNTLNFSDQGGAAGLQIDLNNTITLRSNQKLTGNGTVVNVANTGFIQNGLDVATSGATVNVAAGTYNQTSSVNITKAVNLRGAQAGVDARLESGLRTAGDVDETIIDFGNVSGRQLKIASDNVTVDGFELRNAAGSSTDIIYADTVTGVDGVQGRDANNNGSWDNVTVKNNIIHDGNDEGIQLRDVNNAIIERNNVYDMSGDGINIADGSLNSFIQDNEIYDTHSTNGQIYVYNSSNITIQRNYIHDIIGNDAIKLGLDNFGDTANFVGNVLNNRITGTYQDGIAVYSSGALISGNDISGSQSTNGAIHVQSTNANLPTNVIIENNVIHDNNSRGIRVSKANNLTIRNNTFTNNTGVDVEIRAGQSAAQVNVYGNSFGGAGVEVSNLGSGTLKADDNWWNTTDDAAVQARTTGLVDFSTYLGLGTDTDGGTSGFQGDYSNLFVTNLGAQVGAGTRINDAISRLSDGSLTGGARLVNINDGTFAENVIVNKSLTLQGAGSALTVIDGTGLNNNGILVAASNVTLDGITTQDFRNNYVGQDFLASGIAVNSSINNLKINDVVSSNNSAGMYVTEFATINGLDIDNSAFNGNDYGLYTAKNMSVLNAADDVTNVTVDGTSFNGNRYKGIYLEKLSDATFTNIDVIGSAYDASNIHANVAIEANLKNGAYSNITFDDVTISGGSPTPTIGGKAGVGISVKARNDAPGYNTKPATLTNVTIKNSNIDVSNGDIAVAISHGVTGATVQNNELTGPQGVTVFNGASDITVQGNTINTQGAGGAGTIDGSIASVHGVGLFGAGGTNTIRDNELTGTGNGTGVLAVGVNDVTIGGDDAANDANTVDGYVDGITVMGGVAANGGVKNNAVTDSTGYGIIIDGVNGAIGNMYNVYGNAVGASGADQILVQNGSYVNVENNTTSGYATWSGISFHDQANSRAYDNTIQNNTLVGVYAEGSNGIVIDGNTIANTRKSGVHVEGSNNAEITNNTISNTTEDGINLGGAINSGGAATSGAVISGNTITSAQGNGIYTLNASGTEISENAVQNSILNNIWAHGGSNATITGNVVSGTAAHAGVALRNVTGATISENTITNSGYGLYADGNTTGVNATGNSLTGITTLVWNNGTPEVFNARGNWWGTTNQNTINGKMVGSVDFSTYLGFGTDLNPGATGFQADFSDLFTTTLGAHVGGGRINGAVALLADGSLTGDARTIHVMAGNYGENVVINKAANVRGFQADVAAAGRVGPEAQVNNVTISSDDVTLNGFRINGASNGVTINGNDATVAYNLITNSGVFGVYAGAGTGAMIRDNAVTGIGVHGAGVGLNGHTNATIRNNTIDVGGNAGADGLWIVGGSNGTDIDGNDILNAGRNGITLGAVTGTDIDGNTIENSGANGLFIDGTSTVASFTNNFFKNNAQHINYQNGAGADLDAGGPSGNQFYTGGAYKLTSGMTIAELFALEGIITHKMDNAAYGRVLFGDGLYVSGGSIQSAIDIANEGETVNVDNGTYTEDLVIWVDGLKLTGHGTTLQSAGGANLITITADDVNIDPFVFDGFGVAQYGIYNNGASNLIIDGNTFQNFTQAGVRLDNNTDALITGNTFNNTGIYGVLLNGGTGATIEGGSIANTTWDSIRVVGSSDTTIQNIALSNAGTSQGVSGVGSGIVFVNANGAVVDNAVISDVARIGIYAGGSNDITLTNNILTNIGTGTNTSHGDSIGQWAGIHIEGTNNLTATGNTITGTTGDGINLGSLINVPYSGPVTGAVSLANNSVTNAGRDALRAATDDGMTLGNFTATGTTGLGVNVTNASGTVTVNGLVDTNGADILVDNNGTIFSEQILINAGAGFVSDGGDITLDSNGSGGGFTTNNGTIDAGTGDLAINARQIQLRNGSLTQGNNVHLTGSIANQTAGSTLNATTLTGSLAANANLIGTNNQIVNLGNFATGTAGFSTGGFVLNDTTGGINVTGMVTADGGDIQVTGNGTIFSEQILIGAGAGFVSGNGNITLNSNGGFTTNNGTIDAGTGDLAINARQIQLRNGSLTQGNNVHLTGSIANQTAGSTLNATTLTGSLGAHANLIGTNNQIGTLGAFATGTAGFSTGGFNLNDSTGGLTIAGNVSTDGGDIDIDTAKGDLVVNNGVTLSSQGGSISLTANDPDVVFNGVINAGAGAVNLSGDNVYLNGGSSITGGTLTTTAVLGFVAQESGAVLDVAKLTGSAASYANFGGDNNLIDTLGAFATGTPGTDVGGFTLENAQSLDVDGAVTTEGGNVDIDVAGDLALLSGGSIDAKGGNIDLDQTGIFSSVDADTLNTSGTGTITLHQRNGGSINNAIRALNNIGTGMNTLTVDAGLFNENVLADQANLDVMGTSGGTVIDGTGLMGHGLTVAADNVLLDGLTMQNFTGEYFASGIAVTSAINDLALNDITSRSNSFAGLYVSNSGGIDGLTVTDAHFDDNGWFGWYLQNDVVGTGTNVRNVDVSNSSFNGNDRKGIYAEKLSDATFTNVDVIGSANEVANPFGNVAIDVNLKFGNYQNITFDDVTVDDGGYTAGAMAGAGIAIKARNDGPTYGANPASLTGVIVRNSNVDTTGGDIALAIGNNVNGVTIENNTLTGPQGITVYGDVSNVGITGNTINTAGTSTGTLDSSGPSVHGIKLTGTGGTNTISDNVLNGSGTGIGIGAINTANVTIGGAAPADGNTVDGYGTGISTDNAATALIRNNLVTDSTGRGILVSGGSNVDLLDNVIYRAGDDGIEANNSAGIEIRNNKIGVNASNVEQGANNIGGEGIDVNGSAGAQITGNYVRQTVGNGISVNPSPNALIQSNNLANIDGHGIMVAAGNHGVDVLDNQLTGIALDGIHAEGSNDLDILRNEIRANGTVTAGALGNGIYVAGGTSALIEDNIIQGGNGASNTAGKKGAGLNAIHVDDNDGVEIVDNLIKGGNGQNTFSGNPNGLGGSGAGGHGIYLTNSQQASIRDNDILVGSNNGLFPVKLGGQGADLSGIYAINNAGQNTAGKRNGIYIGNNIIDGTGSVDSAGDDGIFVQNSGKHSSGSVQTTVENNQVRDTGEDGIDVRGTNGVVIAGNTIENVSEIGIRLNPSDNAVINNNTIAGTGDDGIVVLSSSNVDVTSNTLRSIGGDGIYGENSNSLDIVLNTIGNGAAFTSGAADNGIFVNGGRNVKIDQNTIQGGLLSVGAGEDGIRVINNREARITSNIIKANGSGSAGALGHGIYVDYSGAQIGGGLDAVLGQVRDGVVVTGNQITASGLSLGAGLDGIRVINSDGGLLASPQATVAQNTVTGVGRDGIYVETTDGIIVNDNDVTGTADDGIEVRDSLAAAITNNTVTGTLDNGIVLADSALANVSGNTVTGAGADGINIIDVAGLTASGNTVTGVAGDGMDVRNVASATLSLNTITGAVGFGIFVDPSLLVTISGNTVLGAGLDGIHAEDVAGLTVDGNTVTGAGDDGIEVLNSGAVSVTGNTVTGTAGNGIEATNILVGTFDGNAVTGAAGNGILLAGGVSIDITGNTVTGVALDGVNISDVIDLTANGNSVTGAGDDGIEVANVAAADVSGNTVTLVADNGIELSDLAGATVNGNTITGAGDSGIVLDGGALVSIDGNTIAGAVVDGIRAANALGLSVSGNTVALAGDDGIDISAATPATVDGNTIVAAGDNGIIFDGGALASVSGNTVLAAGTDGIAVRNVIGLAADGNTVDFAGDNGIEAVNLLGGSIDTNSVAGAGNNGIVLDGGALVSVSGNTVAATGNDGIQVTDVAGLDASGNSVALASGDGLDVRNVAGAVIDGNTVTGVLGHGIFVDPSLLVSINGNTVTGAALDGIHALDVLGLQINGNTVTLVGDDGIEVENSAGVDISSNTVSLALDDGIAVDGAAGLNVTGNEVSFVAGDGIDLHDAALANISGNTVTAVFDNGIEIDDASLVLVSGNTVSGTGNDGINADNVTGLAVVGNTVSLAFGDGIDVDDAEFAAVIGNTVTGVLGNGIEISDSDAAVVASNIVAFTGNDGINVDNSDGILVANNQAGFAFGDGIDVSGSNNADIDGNLVRNTFDNGIEVTNSDDATISNNTIRDTLGNGIDVTGGTSVDIILNTLNNIIDAIGIRVDGANDVAISDNTLTNDAGVSSIVGIEVNNGTDVLIGADALAGYGLNTVTTGTEAGIRINGGDTIIVTDNIVSDPDDGDDLADRGIEALNVTNAFFVGNQVSGRNVGIYVDPSSNVNVSFNVLNGNGIGVQFIDVTDSLIDTNTITNSGTTGIEIGGLSDNVTVNNNTVDNSGQYGLLASGNDNGLITLTDNVFTNNPTGIRLESGNVDLSDTANENTINGGLVGLQLAPLVPDANLTLIGDTLGETRFNGQANFYVRLEDNAYVFGGSPFVIDGVNAFFDGFSPALSPFGPGILTLAQFNELESKLWDLDDLTGRGQIFIGFVPGLANEDLFPNGLGNFGAPGGGFSVTILGLPTVPGGGAGLAAILNNLSPFAGDGSPEALAAINPAAGGEGEDLNTIEPAGGNAANCWSDVANSVGAGAVNFSFGGSVGDNLNAEANCGS